MTDQRRMLNAARRATIVVHLLLVGVLLAIALPHVGWIAAQAETGYVPYPELQILAVAVPVSLAPLTLFALIRWLQGRHFLLVGVDVATTLASWSVPLVYLFGNDLPLASLVLSPTALVLAALVPRATARLRTVSTLAVCSIGGTTAITSGSVRS